MTTSDLFADHPWKGKTTKVELSRVSFGLPPIPDTGWKVPTTFPSLASAKLICIDLETYDPDLKTHGPGWGRGVGHVVGFAIGTNDGFRKYFPVNHTVGTGNLPLDAVVDWLKVELSRPEQGKVFANAQYDLGWLSEVGVEVAGKIIDVQIAEPLLDEHAQSYSLDNLAQKYLGEHKVDSVLYTWSQRAYGGKVGRPQAANIYRCPPSLVGHYAEGDVDLPLRIWACQEPLIKEQGLEEVFRIESALPRVLVGMRKKGIRVNVQKAEQRANELRNRVKETLQEIKTATGHHVDIWAADSVAKVFDVLGVTYGKTPTGKPSFPSEFLNHHMHPVAKAIATARKYDKAVGTFIDGYVLNAQINGRVHGQFHQLRSDEGGTVVGRFSSSLPNLENLPARDPELGPMIRDLFLPEEDNLWHCLDLSQVQFRLMVHYAMGRGAEEARQKYIKDPTTDYHDLTKALIFETTGVDLARKTVKCIAEGQLVLTDKGLVPIEKITNNLRVWDGLKYVNHDGVVYKGYQEVITYEGLTATPDHKVWLQTGECVPIGEAASAMGRPRLATGEVNGKTVRFENGDARSGERGVCNRILQSLSTDLRNRALQPAFGKDIQQVSLPNTRSPLFTGRTTFTRTTRGLSPSLYTTQQPVIQKLRSEGNRITVYRGRICSVLLNNLSGSCVSEASTRPNRQRRALRSRKYTLCFSKRKPTQYATLSRNDGVRTFIPYAGRSVRVGTRTVPKHLRSQWNVNDTFMLPGNNGRADTVSSEKRFAHVYDIINAGDLHRFTVSGKVVNNCVNFGLAFTMGLDKLARELGLTKEEAKPLIDGYHEGVPFIRHTSDKIAAVAAQRGYLIDIIGRRHRFPHWEARDWNLHGKVPLSTDYATVAANVQALTGKEPTQRDIVRAFTHLGMNRLAQSGEGAIMKKAIVDCYEEGIFDVLGFPLNIVHDDISLNRPQNKAGEEAIAEVKHKMETAVSFKVPILVSQEEGATWGSCEKV